MNIFGVEYLILNWITFVWLFNNKYGYDVIIEFNKNWSNVLCVNKKKSGKTLKDYKPELTHSLSTTITPNIIYKASSR